MLPCCLHPASAGNIYGHMLIHSNVFAKAISLMKRVSNVLLLILVSGDGMILVLIVYVLPPGRCLSIPYV